MGFNKKNKSLSKNTKLPKTRRIFRRNQRGGMTGLTKFGVNLSNKINKN